MEAPRSAVLLGLELGDDGLKLGAPYNVGVQLDLLFGCQGPLGLAGGLKRRDLFVEGADLALGVPQAIFLGFGQARRSRAG